MGGYRDRSAEEPGADLLLDRIDKLAQAVTTGQDQFDHTPLDRQFPPAGRIEQGFQTMGQILDRDETQKASAPFEGVKGSEHLIEGVPMVGGLLQDQHSLFDLGQEIPAFVAEFVEQFQVIVCRDREGRFAGFSIWSLDGERIQLALGPVRVLSLGLRGRGCLDLTLVEGFFKPCIALLQGLTLLIIEAAGADGLLIQPADQALQLRLSRSAKAAGRLLQHRPQPRRQGRNAGRIQLHKGQFRGHLLQQQVDVGVEQRHELGVQILDRTAMATHKDSLSCSVSRDQGCIRAPVYPDP